MQTKARIHALLFLFVFGCIVGVDAASGAVPTVAELTLPFAFEQNGGQTEASVRFLARGGGLTVLLRSTGLTVLTGTASPVRITFRGANAEAPLGAGRVRLQDRDCR